MQESIATVFYRLSNSSFRSKFHLNEKEKQYIKSKGYDMIQQHANAFIEKRLKSKEIPNDGKQTPMKGHPVFIAQHATATCCRGCLEKWHKISSKKELNPKEISYVVKIIMTWIQKEMNE